MALSLSRAQHVFGQRSWQRGLIYARQGAVSGVSVSEGVLTATVKGNAEAPYRVELRLNAQGVPAKGFCTCPVGYDGRCKHAAAALIAGATGAASAARPASDTLGASAKTATVEAWAKKHRVEDWLDAPLLAVRQAGQGWFYRQEHLPLRAVLDSGEAWAAHTRRGVIAFLNSRAERRRDALAREKRRLPIWKKPQPEAHLAELQQDLLALRTELRRAALPDTGPKKTTLELHGGEEQLVYREGQPCLGRSHGDAEVRVDVRAPLQVRCSCSEEANPDCATALRAVNECLELLVGTQALRKELSKLLSVPAWKLTLEQLDHILRPTAAQDPEGRELSWMLSHTRSGLELTPALTRPYKTRAGLRAWKISVDRALDTGLATPADHEALALAAGGTRAGTFRAVRALIGHPRVLLDGASSPVRVARRQLSLRASPLDEGVQLEVLVDGEVLDEDALDEKLARQAGGVALDLGGDDIGVIEISPRERALLDVLQRRGAHFPKEASAMLMERVPQLQQHTRAEVSAELRGREVQLDGELLLRAEIVPGPALQLRARLKLLPGQPFVVPGEGADEQYGLVDGERVWVQREHATERAFAHQQLEPLDLDPHTWSWEVADPERVLQLIERMNALDVEVEWAKQAARVATGGLSALDLRISSRKDWFGLEGELLVEGLSVPVGALLEAVRDGRRFVQAGDAGFVRLEEPFRKALQQLAAAARARRDEVELPLMAAPVLEALAEEGLEVDAPEDWVVSAERLRASATLDPAVPEGLEATLRPYQLTGFRWLARLAHWSPGACLADDMGLGKTVQALALLLRRAADGPALVVAPTSVGFNWVRETERFAPGLEVVAYRGTRRKHLLGRARAGVVFVTSYDLLVRDEGLQAIGWNTLVLDEAQAIKNPTTKRARACRDLEAGFKLALTGTPVENRVSELWSLFRVLTPGLLGSAESFRDRFAKPIELDQAREPREALSALIRPFVLRRLKREVATELPERTEVVVLVEPSKAEQQLYDRVRLAALESLTNREAPGWRFSALQALTRLRQLACHPQLVLPDSAVPSSKLEAVLERLETLRDEGHRALIFSQFVGHLKLLRASLDEQGVSYRYLDGSTPATKRQQEVDAFQDGEGEVFLISLKAGGTGLNLTAATYVLHLDPWWNPAVEDQATDRTHRIGQTHAVTVYRFVTEGTVEQSIVELQAEKRELAEALLSGTDTSAALGPDELLGLLTGA